MEKVEVNKEILDWLEKTVGEDTVDFLEDRFNFKEKMSGTFEGSYAGFDYEMFKKNLIKNINKGINLRFNPRKLTDRPDVDEDSHQEDFELSSCKSFWVKKINGTPHKFKDLVEYVVGPKYYDYNSKLNIIDLIKGKLTIFFIDQCSVKSSLEASKLADISMNLLFSDFHFIGYNTRFELFTREIKNSNVSLSSIESAASKANMAYK